MQLRRLLPLLLLSASLAMAQQAAAPGQPASEMETKEAPAKFTSRVNLVPLTVVVRDRNGHAVGSLTKEDFRLLDNGKPQVIAKFSIEKPGTPVVLEKEAGVLGLQPESQTAGSGRGRGAACPRRPLRSLPVRRSARDLRRLSSLAGCRDARDRSLHAAGRPGGDLHHVRADRAGVHQR